MSVRLSVCLSVCPSVTLRYRDHIMGWNASKMISPLVSLGVRFCRPNITDLYSKGNTPKFWWEVVGCGKKWLSVYKNSNISEMQQDRTKFVIKNQ